MLRSVTLTLALLIGTHGESPAQEPRPWADLEAAQVVWSYDTGG